MKKLLLGAILLLAFFAAILILAGLYTDRLVDPYVRNFLETNTPMGHRIEYKNIKINLFRRVIKIRDAKMSPGPSLNKDENIWMDVSVATIKLTKFDIGALLFDKTLNIGEFILINPDVVVTLPMNPPEEIIDSVQIDREKRAEKQILQSISLERFVVAAGHFRLVRNEKTLASSPDINFITDQIKLVKNSLQDTIGYTYGKMKLTLSDVSLYSESGLYDMSVEEFKANKEDSTIILSGFKMIPKYDKKGFSSKLKFQDDRFDIYIGTIKIARIGIEKLIFGGDLHISAITLDSLRADIYRDKNVAFNINKFPVFHNEMFMKLPLPLYLDTLAIRNSRIQYGELVQGKSDPGIIILENFSLTSLNLTNQVDKDTARNVMRLDVKANVMGEGPLNAELLLPLEGDMRKIECKGSVGAMNLAPLNTMLEPSLNMKFNTGRLDRMTFSFTGNDNNSTGWMEFLYHDLNVELLKKESEKQWGFVSFMANTMTLSNNPAPGKDLKIVSIGYERDKNKGMINFIWKTIQSGMIHTILPIKKYQLNRKSDAEKPADGYKSKKKK